jgi:hypothetical protein
MESQVYVADANFGAKAQLALLEKVKQCWKSTKPHADWALTSDWLMSHV